MASDSLKASEYYLDRTHDGWTNDLDGAAVTMWDSKFNCPTCHSKLAESGRRMYCYTCGVWWWKD